LLIGSKAQLFTKVVRVHDRSPDAFTEGDKEAVVRVSLPNSEFISRRQPLDALQWELFQSGDALNTTTQ
jgi:hypothetical protein